MKSKLIQPASLQCLSVSSLHDVKQMDKFANLEIHSVFVNLQQ